MTVYTPQASRSLATNKCLSSFFSLALCGIGQYPDSIFKVCLVKINFKMTRAVVIKALIRNPNSQTLKRIKFISSAMAVIVSSLLRCLGLSVSKCINIYVVLVVCQVF